MRLSRELAHIGPEERRARRCCSKMAQGVEDRRDRVEPLERRRSCVTALSENEVCLRESLQAQALCKRLACDPASRVRSGGRHSDISSSWLSASQAV